MKTCKDCIHYEVIKTESSSYCLCSKAFQMSERRRHDSTIECEQFKEKSKIIELPCSIGGTVYVIHYVRKSCNSCDRYSDFYGLDPICDEHKILFPNINDDKKNICNKHYLEISEYKVDLEWIIWQLDQFGKTVFLSREEAEKKLEELK